jgi:inhibitor of KinA
LVIHTSEKKFGLGQNTGFYGCAAVLFRAKIQWVKGGRRYPIKKRGRQPINSRCYFANALLPSVMPLTGPSYHLLSEYAISIQFGHSINENTLRIITSFNHYLLLHPFPGLVTTVPAYTTLSVFYEPVQVIQSHQLQGDTPSEKVIHYLSSLYTKAPIRNNNISNTVIIPVCYSSSFGPDLPEVANTNGLTIEEVIHLHTEATYTVYMLGFVPGFAYLGGMNERLATPRKPTPRQAVPAGSVGIAGGQTGIYPLETPGGWQLIGRTPLRLFDAGRPQPSWLQAGDLVTFQPISAAEFDDISREKYANTY